MTTRNKIIIGAISIVIIGILAYGITQGIQLIQLEKELKEMNERHVRETKEKKRAKQVEMKAYIDSFQNNWRMADSIALIQIEQSKKVNDLLNQRNEIEIPTTTDGRVDELNRIQSELCN